MVRINRPIPSSFHPRIVFTIFVSFPADCFVRIYAEAMIPPERTFRTSDTSSVRLCQELCEAEGNRCQTFSLGISARGNGTCQLSGERISENAGRRPRGTLYDPDFNLYQRKVNCRNDGNDVTGSTGNWFEFNRFVELGKWQFISLNFRWNIANDIANDIL